VDFGWLAELPDQFEAGAKLGRERELRNIFKAGVPQGPGGEIDYRAAAGLLMGIDPRMGLDLLGKQEQQEERAANREALEQHRQATLAQRTAEFEHRRQPNIIEGLRQKLASGQPLNPGEQRVYDDALRADPLTRLLQGQGNGGPANPPAPLMQTPAQPAGSPPGPRPVPTMRVTPDGAMAPTTGNASALPFEGDQTRRQLGAVYSLPDGRRAKWSQDGQGNVGWELVE
jgi:hypothetical protein